MIVHRSKTLKCTENVEKQLRLYVFLSNFYRVYAAAENVEGGFHTSVKLSMNILFIIAVLLMYNYSKISHFKLRGKALLCNISKNML